MGGTALTAQQEPLSLLDDSSPEQRGHEFQCSLSCSYQGSALSQHSPGTRQESPDGCLSYPLP